MNSNPHNPLARDSVSEAGSGATSCPAEETLRLVASLHAPAGLEDRVHATLRLAPNRAPQRQAFVAGVARNGRVLAWPKGMNPQSDRMIRDWMRTAAAAAIVFVVAGGGWSVYTHVQNVQQGQPARVVIMPRVIQPGGFSGAGAVRTPQTLPGPTVIEPVKPKPVPPKGSKKPAARPAHSAGAQAEPAAMPAARPAAFR